MKRPHRYTSLVAIFLLLVKNKKILLLKRYGTGYMDGHYSLPAGHLEAHETLTQALAREAKEEIGIHINPHHLQLNHSMHYKSVQQGAEYLNFFFTAKKWQGTPSNLEPDKCSKVAWFQLSKLPKPLTPEVKEALKNYKKGITYSELNWPA